MGTEKRTVSAEEITKEYKKHLKSGIIPAGLYSIYKAGNLENKENPKALVLEDADIQRKVMGIFGYKTNATAKAIVSWDNMQKRELCPEMGISPTMIIEPLQIFDAGINRNCIYTSESYKKKTT